MTSSSSRTARLVESLADSRSMRMRPIRIACLRIVSSWSAARRRPIATSPMSGEPAKAANSLLRSQISSARSTILLSQRETQSTDRQPARSAAAWFGCFQSPVRDSIVQTRHSSPALLRRGVGPSTVDNQTRSSCPNEASLPGRDGTTIILATDGRPLDGVGSVATAWFRTEPGCVGSGPRRAPSPRGSGGILWPVSIPLAGREQAQLRAGGAERCRAIASCASSVASRQEGKPSPGRPASARCVQTSPC
jgi:hypothetical protein